MNWAQWLDLCTATSEATFFGFGCLVGASFTMAWELASEAMFRWFRK